MMNAANVTSTELPATVATTRTYRFSLRMMEQCFTEINLILRTTPSNATIYPGLLSFLVAFKAFNPAAYDLLGGSLSYPRIKELLTEIAKDLDLSDSDIVWMLAQFTAYLLYGYLEQEEKIKDAVLELTTDEQGKAYAPQLIQIMSHVESDHHVVKDLVAMLNLAV